MEQQIESAIENQAPARESHHLSDPRAIFGVVAVAGTAFASRFGLHRAIRTLIKRMRQELCAFRAQGHRPPRKLAQVMVLPMHHPLALFPVLFPAVDPDEESQGSQILFKFGIRSHNMPPLPADRVSRYLL
jgi:hypothetical protein